MWAIMQAFAMLRSSMPVAGGGYDQGFGGYGSPGQTPIFLHFVGLALCSVKAKACVAFAQCPRHDRL